MKNKKTKLFIIGIFFFALFSNQMISKTSATISNLGCSTTNFRVSEQMVVTWKVNYQYPYIDYSSRLYLQEIGGSWTELNTNVPDGTGTRTYTIANMNSGDYQLKIVQWAEEYWQATPYGMVHGTAGYVTDYEVFSFHVFDDADDDMDGLTNDQENYYGTDPSKTDSDPYYKSGSPILSYGDGLSDYEEIFIYNTDPLKIDTDGDTATDGIEIIWNSDPLIKDTDNDGLNDGLEITQGFDPNSPPAANKYAILVAASSTYGEDSTEDFRDLIDDWYLTFRYTYGYPANNIRIVIDELDSIVGVKNYEADFYGVRNAFEEIGDQIDSNSQVTLVWCGHGMDNSASDNSDEKSTLFELGSIYYDDSVLGGLINFIDTGKLSVFMSTCHSEGFINDMEGDNRFIYTACKIDEVSNKKFPLNLRDSFNNKNIRDNYYNADGFWAINEAFNYINSYVELTDEDGNEYHPQYSIGSGISTVLMGL